MLSTWRRRARSASEIAQDIAQKETDVQRLMFCMPIVTV